MKFESYFKNKASVGLYLLRLFVGLRLFYGVIDNVVNRNDMLEFAHFLEQFNFPFPTTSAVVSVYIQLIGSLFILAGFKIRITSLIMALNFVIALFFVHIAARDSIENMTPALAMLFGSLTLLFTGAGRISVDNYSSKK